MTISDIYQCYLKIAFSQPLRLVSRMFIRSIIEDDEPISNSILLFLNLVYDLKHWNEQRKIIIGIVEGANASF